MRKMKPDEFKKPRNRWVNKVYIHCSASDASGLDYDNPKLSRTIDRWHRQRGWSGIGYHFTVDKKGILATGRNIERVPAAQGGHNRGTIAIMLHGLEKDKFTEEQFKTLKRLCKTINYKYDGHITFHGHCEVSPKSCPVFDYKEVLDLDEDGNMEL